MEYYLGYDAYKKYSVFAVISESGEIIPPKRVEYNRQEYTLFLKTLSSGANIAVDTLGNMLMPIVERIYASVKTVRVTG